MNKDPVNNVNNELVDEILERRKKDMSLMENVDAEVAMLKNVCSDFNVDYLLVKELANIEASFFGRSHKSGRFEAIEQIIVKHINNQRKREN